MKAEMRINDKSIGRGRGVYVIAEMSANHRHDIATALKIIAAAGDCGADAVKIQTYTPDTLTIDERSRYFRIEGTPWHGKTLYDLYAQAYTPWEWHPQLKEAANDLGMDLFSSPFDGSAVDFLENLGVPAYKVASFELVDMILLRRIAATGKPVIMSTGMATLSEIDEAVQTLRRHGCSQIALLKCTSAYPAMPQDANLKTIPHMSASFGVPAGLSDHSPGIAVAVAAVALGACIVEKHLTLRRSEGGPDASFSLEPDEFKAMVDAVRTAEQAVGEVSYDITASQVENRVFRRSLFVVRDVGAGEALTLENVRSIRPGHGLHTRYLEKVLGRRARGDIPRGTPLDWDLIN